MPTYLKPVVVFNSMHSPTTADQYLDPWSMPVSSRAGNRIQVVADGLYAGALLGQTVYYISTSLGSDLPTYGTKTNPFKTLDYCLTQLELMSGGIYTSAAIIALRAGETYPMYEDFLCAGQATFSFWGDPNYGDFDSVRIGSPGTDPALMSDLSRPVITPRAIVISNSMAGVRLSANLTGSISTVSLKGVRVDLPVASPGATGGYCDFITALTDATAKVVLYGAIVNISDTAATFGLLGIHPRAQMTTVSEFGSQLWVLGAPVTTGAATATLLARQKFFKFYQDYLGNDQVTGMLTGGSPGSSLIQLNWSLTSSMPVITGKTNLATYPILADTSFGLGQYFTNLARDQQQRPLNVISAALL